MIPGEGGKRRVERWFLTARNRWKIHRLDKSSNEESCFQGKTGISIGGEKSSMFVCLFWIKQDID